MTHILSLILTAFMCLAGTGCGQDEVTFSQEAEPQIAFTLPQAWKVEYGEHRSAYRAKKYELAEKNGKPYRTEIAATPTNSPVEYIVLEMMSISKGGEQDAQDLAKKYQKDFSSSHATYQESLLGDQQVYELEIETDQAIGDLHTQSLLVFEKDGWVVAFSLSDKITQQSDALAMLVETFKTTHN